jgi:proteic killer suppression protein
MIATPPGAVGTAEIKCAEVLCDVLGSQAPNPCNLKCLSIRKTDCAGSKKSDLLSYRYPVYSGEMIRSFGDKRTETLFWDGVVREFRSIAPRAKRKLEAINAASRLEDLQAPPSNRLEKLKGDLSGFHSIRINDQWRIIFKWLNGEPHAVQIVDYH